jgi:hypothetical protein
MFDDIAPIGSSVGASSAISNSFTVGTPLHQAIFTRASDILLFGLDIISPVLSALQLKQYPSIADKYFSFLQYILSALEDRFMSWLCGNPPAGMYYIQVIC